jgi:hypothetical protein
MHDLYLCPQGYELTLQARRKTEAVLVYRADAATCNTCPVKAHCTNSRSGRHIFRSFYQDYLDQAAAYRSTEAYQKALRKRLVWVEPLFGEAAKQWHNMVRFRLRGLKKVNIEGVLKAAGQNIKRFLNYHNWWNPKHPARGALLSLVFSYSIRCYMPPSTTGLLLTKDFFNTLYYCAT